MIGETLGFELEYNILLRGHQSAKSDNQRSLVRHRGDAGERRPLSVDSRHPRADTIVNGFYGGYKPLNTVETVW